MSAVVSDLIPCVAPEGAALRLVRDERAGTLTMMLRVGGLPATVSLDAAGWRALHAALGLPPVPESTTHVRACLRCGRGESAVRHWAAANLCMACMPLAARPKGGCP